MSALYRAGQTVLLAPVEEAEPAVAHWRNLFDATSAEGIPAHISVLFPFVARSDIDASLLAALGELIGEHRAIDFVLSEVRRFPDGNLYLAPDPSTPFRRLTEAIWNRWPEHPPYEGRFDEVIPHLTVAIAPPEDRVREVEAELSTALPISAHVSAVQLLAYEPGQWCELADFNLAT